MGLLVDRVSDILAIPANILKPVPDVTASGASSFPKGIIAQPNGMICWQTEPIASRLYWDAANRDRAGFIRSQDCQWS